MHLRILFMVILLSILPWGAEANSGLPVPRMVSLKSEEVNMRTGPGTRYPIKWVYQSKGQPMEVIEEFEYWRKIKDFSGEVGWVHKSMLSGRRTVIVSAKDAIFHHRMDAESPAIFRAKEGVIGELLECHDGWCRVQVEGIKGWVADGDIWGEEIGYVGE